MSGARDQIAQGGAGVLTLEGSFLSRESTAKAVEVDAWLYTL